MKFTTLAFATAVSAGVISDILDGVDKDIQALSQAVGSYSGDQAPLVAAAKKLIGDISDGTPKVSAAPNLEIGEAGTLAASVTTMTQHGDALEKALLAKRDQVQKAGACATVRQITSDLASKSQALIDATVPKVPDTLQPVAKDLSGKLTATLNKAQDDFSESNCKDSGSSNPTGGASSSAAPSGGASSAAPTGGASSAAPTSAAPTGASKPAGSSSAPAATGTAPVTVPQGSAGMVAPAGLFAAAVAAFAL